MIGVPYPSISTLKTLLSVFPFPHCLHLACTNHRIMTCLHRLLLSFLIIICAFYLNVQLLQALSHSTDPVPTPWPEQFHSILFMNNSKGVLQKTDLWYDSPNGRNFNIIQNQLGKLLYDLEWDNGTSYIYTLDSNRECKVVHFDVGILRPNWLDGANFLGQKYMDGFLCNVWEKVDFIWYYEDVDTKRPVYWEFYTGMIAHVMTFEVGKVLEDPNWQAPVYCFVEKNKKPTYIASFDSHFSEGSSMRGGYTMPSIILDS